MEEYKIIRSDRKTVSIEINDNLEVVVRAPRLMSRVHIKIIVDKHQKWIETHLKKKEIEMSRKITLSDSEIEKLKAKAKEILPQKIEHYSALMGVTPTGIKITSAKKRFGSCSGKNSLCFSFYLFQYPDDAIDYVVVHELAHIKHHDHSKEFYAFIESVMPDYKEKEKMLKNKGLE